jgi:hypothetical protein
MHIITQCNAKKIWHHHAFVHWKNNASYDYSIQYNEIWHHHTFGLWKNSTHDCFNVMHQDMTSPPLWTLEKQHTWLLQCNATRYDINTQLYAGKTASMITQCNATRYKISTFWFWKNSTHVCFMQCNKEITSIHIWILIKTHVAACGCLCTHLW